MGDKLDNKDELIKLMKTEYTYPATNDKNLQEKIYKKREFYYHKIPERPDIKTYEELKNLRETICRPGKFEFLPHQALMANLMNPDTPYRGQLAFGGVGVGKCCDGSTIICINNTKIAIEEIWDKYHTKIIKQDSDGGEWSLPNKSLIVESYNCSTKNMVKSVVKHLYRQKISELMKEVILENNLKINITLAHKLFSNDRWTNNFKINDDVTIYSNYKLETRKVKNIRYYNFIGYVYDLEVDIYHNYIANSILCHNTALAINVAERFKPMVQKYGTKIHILTSGPLLKENWKRELLKVTGETYLKSIDNTIHINEQERNIMIKNALGIAMQYYRFMSYRSFYKKVLGEKIRDTVKTSKNNVKVVYRKTDEGEFERDIAMDRISNLNNGLLIIDEAHNLTGNAYGDALKKIIESSTNLRILLLTATPMKNLADDIIELINFIRPINNPIIRDKVFTSEKGHEMQFREGGPEYLGKMVNGYVSYLRGADPLTFARRIDMGVVPPGLLFTKVIRSKMNPFQKQTYEQAQELEEENMDKLDRKSQAVANFAFPGLSDKKQLIGYYGNNGLNIVRNQIMSNPQLLNKKIALELLNDSSLEDNLDLITLSESGKAISGKILEIQYLKIFSIKFYKALKNINKLVWGQKSPQNAFVYSNLVKVGIDLFQEVLVRNGYLEFNPNATNYKIKPNTRCYYCGLNNSNHNIQVLKEQNIPDHIFYPATFLPVTGRSTEEEVIPEEKKKILDNVFNSLANVNGKFIKLVLGSKVMTEGISLRNVGEVHILDVHYNLGRIDQVIGRAIRHCSHYQLMTEENPYPIVQVYKYVISLNNKLSSEEELYRKAEQKYLMVKKVERILKENAIDCGLNRSGNIFAEELEKYKDCIPLDDPNAKNTDPDKLCPQLCDFTHCNFVCASKRLNEKYFNPDTNSYRPLKKSELDYTTFTQNLAQTEIDNIKEKIKDLYRFKYVYTLKNIINQVKRTYHGEKRELFDVFFVFMALNELIPITENDFNNFKDTIYDKYNRPGYIIYVDMYYIFQPFDQPENVPMYYRTIYDKPLRQQLTLNNYLKSISKLPNITLPNQILPDTNINKPIKAYDFDSVMEYYELRPEFSYVGIIDKATPRKKTQAVQDIPDTFKIRKRRSNILEKKRGTGITSFLGAQCNNAHDRKNILKIMKYMGISTKQSITRTKMCDQIQDYLYFKEKYSLGKDKMTYFIVPANHPDQKKYPFPLNLQDRVQFIKDKIKEKIKFKLDMNVENVKTKVDNQNVTTYIIKINNDAKLNSFREFLEQLGFNLERNKWILNID